MVLQLCNSGCAKEKYVANPINHNQIIDQLTNKNINSAGFNDYLLSQGFNAHQLPFSKWGLNELTHCALYHHTKLNIAKSQLALANAQIDTVNLRQAPIINNETSRSNRKNNDISPWALSLSVQIPIETTNKRESRVEEASFFAQAAKLDVADIAWQLRSQIAVDLLRYHQHIALINIHEYELDTQTKIINILQKRVDLGVLSNTDLNIANLTRQISQATLIEEQSKLAEIRANLAASVGLSVENFDAITLKQLDMEKTLSVYHLRFDTIQKFKSLQADALLNRIDVRRSLAKYSAAESRIKLEIAMQTPDILLSPGYAFEFGDSVWSLGFSSLLSLLKNNQTLINEATVLREIEGAQFEALQASIIATLNQKIANYQTSINMTKSLKTQLEKQLQQSQKLNKQFAAGLIDRLKLNQNQLDEITIKKQLLAEEHHLLKCILSIEDVMQKPISEAEIIYK